MMGSPALLAEPGDFSVVLGGPLYQAYRRAHLCGDALELVVRRVIVVTTLAWLPLLILSALDGTLLSGVRQPFLLDIDVHARLLIALPLLILTECAVHQRLRSTVRAFLDRGLVPVQARAQFDATIATAMRWRNSTVAEVMLIAFVYIVGILAIWRGVAALDIDTWYRQVSDGRQVRPAGWWYFLISLPLFQFLLFRWYYRLLIWAWFLWRVVRGGLSLVPTHPDRCAGLGFVGFSTYALIPLLFAHGALFAGVAAGGILFEGRDLIGYWPELVAATSLVLAIALAPMLVFVPTLFRAKRDGFRDYGLLAQRYVRDFDCKWLRGGSSGEPVLGSGDIQSLADLANSYQVISGIRMFVVNRNTVMLLIVATLLPLAPLSLTIFSPREVLGLIWKGLF